MEDIAQRIASAMKDANMTYVELSQKTGISKSALQRYVTRETVKIPLNRIELMADALGVTAAHLLGWDKKDSPIQIDERVWKAICKNNTKFILATWIAELDEDDLSKVFGLSSFLQVP